MKIRGSGTKAQKIETQMAPMIDVVFQLLIFFLLTLKIIEPEGDFNVNMPIAAPSENFDQPLTPDIKVRMTADPQTGELTGLFINQRPLGTGDEAFYRLNTEILQMTSAGTNPLTRDMEVEIDADYELNWDYVIQAVSSSTGQIRGGRLTRFVEKIKFAAPRQPRARAAG